MLPPFFPFPWSLESTLAVVCACECVCVCVCVCRHVHTELQEGTDVNCTSQNRHTLSCLAKSHSRLFKKSLSCQIFSNNRNGQTSSILWTINTFRKKVADRKGCWEVFKRHLFPTWACRGAAARTPWPLHLIYTMVCVAPFVTTQLGAGLHQFRPQNTVYLCYDSNQNVPGKPSPLTPLKMYTTYFY